MKKRPITRRDFLKGGVATTLAVTISLPFRIEKAEAKKKTRVVLIRDVDVMDRRGRVNPKVIQRMLDEGITTLFGKENAVEAWELLIRPTDIVGIKSNVWGPLPTPKELENALKRRIMDAGVPEEKIAIDDRGVLKNRIFLNSTALINVRPLRTHHWAGVGGCIKNYIMFATWPPLYHPDSCADLGAVWKLPHHFDPTYTWPYKGILVGTDPVAVDRVGLRILELKRLAYFGENIPLRPPAKHIAIADNVHKIGTSDPREIELIKLGWMEGMLI